MTLMEQFYAALVVLAFVAFSGLIAFLSLSEHFYDLRQRRSGARVNGPALRSPDVRTA